MVKINRINDMDYELERRVLSEIVRSGSTSRADIALQSGLSNSSVSRIVGSLTKQGLVAEEKEIRITPAKGRPRQLISVNPSIARVAGVDLGVTNTRIVVCDLRGDVIAMHTGPTHKGDGHSTWAHTFKIIETVAPGFGDSDRDQCCIAVPGAVAGTNPVVTNAPNLPGVQGTEFISAASENFSRPITVDNDVNMGLTAELLMGKAQGYSSAAMVTIGTGLGTAIAINRTILRGRRGLVGEFGQLSLGPDNRKLEESITGKGLLELAHSINLQISSPSEIFSVPATLAGPALFNFHSALLTVLTALAVASDPDVIVVGGGIGLRLRENLLGYQTSIENNLGSSPSIVATELGEYGTAFGACIQGVEALWRHLDIPVEQPIDSLRSVAERLSAGQL